MNNKIIANKLIQIAKSLVSSKKHEEKIFYRGRFLNSMQEIAVTKYFNEDGSFEGLSTDISNPPSLINDYLENVGEVEEYKKKVKLAISENLKYIKGLESLYNYLDKE